MKAELNYAAMLDVALAEARKGLEEGGIPIGAAIFNESGQLVGKRPQPSRAEWGSLNAWRDGRLPQRGTSAQLSQPHHGDYACSLLVLQWAGAAIWIQHFDRGRKP